MVNVDAVVQNVECSAVVYDGEEAASVMQLSSTVQHSFNNILEQH